MRRYPLLATGLLMAGGAGCTDETPTSGDPDLIPVEATTVEVSLPFEDFADEFRQVGGYGSADGVGVAILAHEFEGALESRGLFRFQEYPDQIDVPDPNDPEETVADTLITPVEGSVRFSFDPDFSRGEPPFELVLFTTEEVWHSPSTTWDMAVDTLGGRVDWSSPGGGEVVEVGRGEWDPEDGDTVSVAVDPEAVEAWADADDPARGLHVRSETPGTHLVAIDAELDVGFESEENPDTIVTETVASRSRTFIYDPAPEPDERMILGGAPAWRSFLRMDLPERFEEPMEVCQQLECPLDLRPGVVVHAEMVLHPQQAPAGFSIKDSVRVDAREVLRPERLPRAPIRAIPGATRAFDQEVFEPGENDGDPVTMPLTNYVRALLEYRERDPDDVDDPERQPSETLTFLVVPEPFRLDVAAFGGPEHENEPELRLILTVSDGVRLP